MSLRGRSGLKCRYEGPSHYLVVGEVAVKAKLTLNLGISSLSELESTLVSLVGFLNINHDTFQPLLKLEDIGFVNCYALTFTLQLSY